MYASKYFRDNRTSGPALSDEQRQHNTDNGMIALAEQLDRIEQAQQALRQRLQNVEAILRGLR